MLTSCIAKPLNREIRVFFEHESHITNFSDFCAFIVRYFNSVSPPHVSARGNNIRAIFVIRVRFFYAFSNPPLFDLSKNINDISVRSCSRRHSCKFARFVVLFLSTSKSDILAKTEAKNFKNLSVHANIFCVDGEKYTVSTQKLLVRANFLCVEEKQRGCFRWVYLGARWPTTAPPAQKSVLCLFAKTCLVIDIYAERTEICVRTFAQIDIFAE